MTDFERFCRLIGLKLEKWQRDLVGEALSPRRELIVLIPRRNGKTTLMAAVALFRLLKDSDAAIVLAAASREQAGHLFNSARSFALSNREVRARLEITRRKLRAPTGRLIVVSADAERQLGWDPSLVVVDELCAHPTATSTSRCARHSSSASRARWSRSRRPAWARTRHSASSGSARGAPRGLPRRDVHARGRHWARDVGMVAPRRVAARPRA